MQNQAKQNQAPGLSQKPQQLAEFEAIGLSFSRLRLLALFLLRSPPGILDQKRCPYGKTTFAVWKVEPATSTGMGNIPRGSGCEGSNRQGAMGNATKQK
jgi:hypothetical protein